MKYFCTVFLRCTKHCFNVCSFPVTKFVEKWGGEGKGQKRCILQLHQKNRKKHNKNQWQESFVSISIHNQLKLFFPELYQFQVASSETRDIWLAIKLALLLLDAWLVRLMEEAICGSVKTWLQGSFPLYEGQAIKRQPGVGVWASISICLSLCSVFNGWLSSCQVHAGLKVDTGWVCH